MIHKNNYLSFEKIWKKYVFILSSLVLFHLVSFGSFLSTDEMHINSNIFEAFNNSPISVVDRNGKQPIFLTYDEEYLQPKLELDAIKMTYKDLDLYHIKHAGSKYIQSDLKTIFKGRSFDGRIFVDSHGLANFDLKGPVEKRQDGNLGDFVNEIEEFTGTKVRSFHFLGCRSAHMFLGKNQIGGNISKSGELIAADVRDDIELYGSKFITANKTLSTNPFVRFFQKLRSQIYPEGILFKRFRNLDIEVPYHTLLDERFEQTQEHGQIFERVVNRERFRVSELPSRRANRHIVDRTEYFQHSYLDGIVPNRSLTLPE